MSKFRTLKFNIEIFGNNLLTLLDGELSWMKEVDTTFIYENVSNVKRELAYYFSYLFD